VGSINIDNRSFLLNDEANATVRSAEFAGKLETMFRRDRDKSDEVTLARWNGRPWSERLLEGVLSLFEPEF
jgi:cardiolipin synthase